MKNIIITFCTIITLVACNIDPLAVDMPNVNETEEINVDLNFTLGDNEGDETKATAKNSFVSGDVVFLFFYSKAEAPKYLELTYNGTSWDAEAKNGLRASDIALPKSTSGPLTALFLPYGSGYTVSADASNNFSIRNASGERYSGIYYAKRASNYWWTEATHTINGGTITLSPFGLGSGQKYIHFDISVPDGKEHHEYYLGQEFVRPLMFNYVEAGGALSSTRGSMGNNILGYYDDANEIVSFSGCLDETAVGNEKNYNFVLYDKTEDVRYYRVVKKKTISNHLSIGLGNYSDTEKWSTEEPTDPYFSVSSTTRVIFAPGNLQYQAKGDDEKEHWRFAEHQYDFVGGLIAKYTYEPVAENVQTGTVSGSDNKNIASDNTGWIDLFGWGTSGWSGALDDTKEYYDPTWEYYYPWASSSTSYSASTPKNKYHYGPAYDSTNKYGLYGVYDQGDWGVHNDILNGSDIDPAGTWRTPTQLEWDYLFNGRSVTNRFAKANLDIDGGDDYGGIHGVILLPDNYKHPSTVPAITGMNATDETSFEANNYTAGQWTLMEDAGAVFLPCAGMRWGLSVQHASRRGMYWSSSHYNSNCGYSMSFSITGVNTSGNSDALIGMSVRLIKVIPAE